VAFGVATLGLVTGAVLGVLVLRVSLTIMPRVLVAPGAQVARIATWSLLRPLDDADAAAALVGALAGAFAGPALGWTLLRKVPLGRAVGGTFVGALGCAIVAEWVAESGILGAFVGCVIAAVSLWYADARRRTGGPGRHVAGSATAAMLPNEALQPTGRPVASPGAEVPGGPPCR
jgi:type IV secretory pathway TrbL component